MTSSGTNTLETVRADAESMVEQPRACPLCHSTEISPFLSAPDRFHWRPEVYSLMRCSSCTGVWLVQPPTPAEMGRHYDEEYHQAITTAGETGADSRWRTNRELILRHKQSGSILDIGCSSGAFLGTMNGTQKKGAWRLYGIEMEPATAARARANTGAEVFVGDASEAPFAPASFDVITCFDLLEHVYEPRVFLTRVLEWLKPGGILYTALPNIDSWESRLFGTYWYGLELPRHLFHFSPVSLRRLAGSIGFEEVSLTTRTSYVERSTDYVVSKLREKVGLTTTPQSQPRKRGLAWKAMRKAARHTLIVPFAAAASRSGAGANMDAIFAKRTSQ